MPNSPFIIQNFFIPGLLMGLTAGLSPGPLLTLVISETLIHGRKNGIKVALAPLFTDIPIIFITVLIFIQLKEMNTILGFISIVGGIFLAYLGYENLKVKESQFNAKSTKDQSLKKAILTNTLSPHPYVFWLSVGGSFLVKGNISECSSFLLGFYVCLIGSKIAIAFLTEKSKTLLKSKYFIFLIRAMGFVLLVFSIILIKGGIEYL
ncbi:MAG: LysE family translocator [Candidatus Cloacimonetes bacterium]|nr:LysE family translocator [Candidatus Cloacimonadota bacterium]